MCLLTECFLLYDYVFIHVVKSVNIFHDGLHFIFHLGRLFLYENYECIFHVFSFNAFIIFVFQSRTAHWLMAISIKIRLENFMIISVENSDLLGTISLFCDPELLHK